MFQSYIIIQTRLLLTRLGELGLDPAHIVGQDEVGYRQDSSYDSIPVGVS